MNYTNRKPLFAIAAILLCAIPLIGADTGIPNYVSWIVSAIALVVGIFIPQPYGEKFKVIKNALLTLIRVVDKVLEAKHKDSAGGRKVTEEEWSAIWAELEGVVETIKPLIKR